MHMDITPYVESLRRDLLAAAESAGEEVRQTAERLGYALDPSARLALMEAISQAAAPRVAQATWRLLADAALIIAPLIDRAPQLRDRLV